jgi:hypothetical protein
MRNKLVLSEDMEDSNKVMRMEMDCLKNQMKVLKNQLRGNSTLSLIFPHVPTQP